MVSEARRYGIRLVLSLVNNYNDYGGKAQYVKWARDAGVQINSNDDFYTNAVLKTYYKNHVQVFNFTIYVHVRVFVTFTYLTFLMQMLLLSHAERLNANKHHY